MPAPVADPRRTRRIAFRDARWLGGHNLAASEKNDLGRPMTRVAGARPVLPMPPDIGGENVVEQRVRSPGWNTESTMSPTALISSRATWLFPVKWLLHVTSCAPQDRLRLERLRYCCRAIRTSARSNVDSSVEIHFQGEPFCTPGGPLRSADVVLNDSMVAAIEPALHQKPVLTALASVEHYRSTVEQ